MSARIGLLAALASAAAFAAPPGPLPPLPKDAPLPASSPAPGPLPPVPLGKKLPAPAAIPAPLPPAGPVVLERFALDPYEELILVPVTVAGELHFFVLDTGCSFTVLDRSLLTAAPAQRLRAATPGGEVQAEMFGAPPMAVGRLKVDGVHAVAGFDLTPIRALTGYPVDGILGMDFLHSHVIQLDFDGGEVRFLKEAHPSCGTPVPMVPRESGFYVPVILAGGELVKMTVDTGCRGSGDLGAGLFDELARRDGFHVVSRSGAYTMAGFRSAPVARADKVGVGEFVVEGVHFGSGAMTILGLGLLSRFTATLDFPDRRLYLRRGAAFAHHDSAHWSGLSLTRVGERPVVTGVADDTAAALAGARRGDFIVRVGDKPVDGWSLNRVLGRLSAKGRTPVVIRRGGVEQALVFDAEW